MNSRIVSLVVILIVACFGVGMLVFVLQAPKDPEGPPPPGFEIPDLKKNPPPAGPGAGDPARGNSIDWKPDDGGTKSKKKGTASTEGTGKSKETP